MGTDRGKYYSKMLFLPTVCLLMFSNGAFSQVPSLCVQFQDIVQTVPPDATTAQVFWVPPADSTEDYTTLSTRTAGSPFGLGDTTVNYLFMYEDQSTVECSFQITLTQTCPDGSDTIACETNPCDSTTCPANANAICRPNYCGQCSAEFYGAENAAVDCTPTETCPDGSLPVSCNNPCDTASCPAFPNAECRPNYCGVCTAEFYNGDVQVDCTTTVPQDECSSQPCQNGATCGTVFGSYYCLCLPGYRGINCENTFGSTDACSSAPCKNGGTCTVTATGYSCQCQSQYSGPTCDIFTPTNCSPNPCQNGGTCTDSANGYVCRCQPQFGGTNCEVDTGSCANNLCLNGGTCAETDTGFVCTCPPEYTGSNCQERFMNCSLSPCRNDGTCIDTVTGYVCMCDMGYTGDHCQEEVPNPTDPCFSNPCENGATCGTVFNFYYCICRDGYRGVRCENGPPEELACLSSPCQNGATCQNVGRNNYACTCAPGFQGTNCEQALSNSCFPNPCLNGGQCANNPNNGYICTCPPGFFGLNCQRDVCPDGSPAVACITNPCDASTCPKYPDATCRPNYCDGCNAEYFDAEGAKLNCIRDSCDDMACPENYLPVCASNGQTYDNLCHLNRAACRDGSITFVHDGECNVCRDSNGNPINEGVSVPNDDPCSTCQCANGSPICSTPGCIPPPSPNCRPIIVPGQCCPTEFDCDDGPATCADVICQNGGTCLDTANGASCTCSPGFTGPTCAETSSGPNDIDRLQVSCPINQQVSSALTFEEVTWDEPKAMNREGNAVNPWHRSHGDSRQFVLVDGQPTAVTYSFTDDTDGETVQCSFVISAVSPGNEDTTPPTITPGTCPSDIRADQETGSSGAEVSWTEPSAVDDNAFGVSMRRSHKPGSRFTRPVTEVRYTFYDVAGNNATCEFDVTVGTPDIDQCLSAPCQNGGRCRKFVGGYRCECPHGYSGVNCETSIPGIDYCVSRPCQNGGRCLSLAAGYRCECPQGYSGVNCQTSIPGIDYCVSRPCQNGGRCLSLAAGYRCECPQGYSGVNCENGVPDGVCSSNPCQQDGRCVSGSGLAGSQYYFCDCKQGTWGVHCENGIPGIDYCVSRPCQNGGRCQSLATSYRCECPQGYSGVNCESSFDFCLSLPCQNGGRCQNDVNGYSCECPQGYSGVNCETGGVQPIDACDNMPCQNNGRCMSIGAQYYCICDTPGTWGINCENVIPVTTPCSVNPCTNGGTCTLDGSGGYTCTCAPGFFGSTCNNQGSGVTDQCANNPCQNSGVCADNGIGGYVCTCAQGYFGANCELGSGVTDQCANNPCQNSGVCADNGIGGYVCTCAQGYFGANCELAVTDPCISNPCGVNGLCVSNGVDGYTCNCNVGFTGILCNQAVNVGNPCDPSPCTAPESCYYLPATLETRCFAPLPSARKRRDTEGVCKPDSCDPRSTCHEIDGSNNFICVCDEHYYGPSCYRAPDHPAKPEHDKDEIIVEGLGMVAIFTLILLLGIVTLLACGICLVTRRLNHMKHKSVDKQPFMYKDTVPHV